MNYKQLNDRMKAQIDALLQAGLLMRAAARQLNISHSTISRYKNNIYHKRKIDIQDKYRDLLSYLDKHYDWQCKSIQVCIHRFKTQFPHKPCVSFQQVYNWINQNKINIRVQDTCYKRHQKRKRLNGMMNHLKWQIDNKTVLPISLRPKRIEDRAELGHLEIDSIIGKRNEYASIISIVDRCSRVLWLIKAESKNEYYIMNLIHKYLIEHEVIVRSITVDNGLEFKAMGIAAKRLGVKLYKCDPYCSYQRGSNEKANGIVRRYIPKGKSMYQVAQQYLDDIMFKINAMPRQLFDFKSAYEVELNKITYGAVEI